MTDESQERYERPDITIGGLRHRLFDTRKKMSGAPGIIQQWSNYAFVTSAALVQIAQELNEIKHILAKAHGDQEER